MRKVFVLGSINMDLTMYTPRMPKTGESVVGRDFAANQGGKGANQAVACAKLGCECHFLGAAGRDSFGEELARSLEKYGVRTEALQRREGIASGTCMIAVDERTRDNMLIVSLGANSRVDTGQVLKYLEKNARAGDLFVTQLEINLDAVEAACARAKQLGMYVILNPAPAVKIGGEILSHVDLIVPNETEAELLTGRRVASARDARAVYDVFRGMGAGETLVTLGARGCVYITESSTEFFPAEKAEAIDPTSAGDTFIGAVASRLCRGESVREAVPYAAKCAAIAVSRRGAACSIPTEEEMRDVWGA